jgi:tetratricopeptide (TPR) repeat protein
MCIRDRAREIHNRQGEGNALGNLGNAWSKLGKVNKAIEYHEQALAIARDIHDRQGEGNTLGNLGSAWSKLGKVNKAKSYLERAKTIFDDIGDPNASDIQKLIDDLGE